jgi:hypothetical protein
MYLQKYGKSPYGTGRLTKKQLTLCKMSVNSVKCQSCIGEWKTFKGDLNKKPAVFLIYSRRFPNRR